MPNKRKHISVICSAAVIALAGAALAPAVALADTTLGSIPDYSVGAGSRGTFVQGSCASANGKSVYVFKQNTARWPNLQKIKLSTGVSTQIALDAASAAAIGHGNGLTAAKVSGKQYLFAAPGTLDQDASKSSHYLLVMRVTDGQAHFIGKVSVPKSVIKTTRSVAVTNVKGTVVTALVTSGKNMTRMTFDMQALIGPDKDADDDTGADDSAQDSSTVIGPGTVTAVKDASISGYSTGCQGISVCKNGSTTWVFASCGGWDTPKSTVIAYTLKGDALTKRCVRFIDGECETAIGVKDRVLLSVEGKTGYNQTYDCVADDKLISVSFPNASSPSCNGWASSASVSYASSLSLGSATVSNSTLMSSCGDKRTLASKITSLTLSSGCAKISSGAFKGFSSLKTITVKNKKLQAADVKGCLKGSNVETIVVKCSGTKKRRAKLLETYTEIFAKDNSGKSVSVVVKK